MAKRRDRVSSDDRERQLVSESSTMDSNSQADLRISNRASASPSLFKPNHFSGSSPADLLPQPPMRRRMNGPSAYDDGMRVRSGDRRSNSQQRRNCGQNMERGQGAAWKNGPIWPGPLANGFIPFRHGPPAPGFSMQGFSPLSLFGARPYMEMNRPGVPYHMHEIANQFSCQVHPFAWHHPVDVSCLSQMNGWDGVNSRFGDNSQVFGGPDWNQNKHLIGGQELNAEMLKGPSSTMAEFSSPPELTNGSMVAYPSLESNSKVENFQHASNAAAHVKQLNNPPPDNKTIESCTETKPKWAPQFQKKLDGDRLNLFNYLSRIEISEDLTHPELYKEVKDILAPVNSAGIYNVSKNEEAKNNRIQNCRKGSSLKSSLVPAATDAFKRAMSVYEKQSFRRPMKPPSIAVCSNEVNVSLEAMVEDGMKLGSGAVPKDPLTVNNDNAASLVGVDDRKSITGDADDSLVRMEVDHVENPDDNSKKQSDRNPDVDILVSSRTCEAIMSVCKVNLIRIHNSAESTR